MSRLEIFFFFQAEDGIRDLIVTGVQTCALPISKWSPAIVHLPPISSTLEHRAALFDKGGDRLLVVLGEGAARLVLGFEVEHGLEILGLGCEQVALHITERDP